MPLAPGQLRHSGFGPVEGFLSKSVAKERDPPTLSECDVIELKYYGSTSSGTKKSYVFCGKRKLHGSCSDLIREKLTVLVISLVEIKLLLCPCQAHFHKRSMKWVLYVLILQSGKGGCAHLWHMRVRGEVGFEAGRH